MNDTIADTETKVVTKIKRPQMYNVVLLNDDFTPMDFVVRVLEEIFFRNHEDSLAIMLEVHHYGKGIAGTYTKDVAETKAEDTNNIATFNEYPLTVTLEPAGEDDSDSDD